MIVSPGTIRIGHVIRDDETVIEQTYRFESGRRSLEVDQLWQSVDGTDAHGGASYGFDPDGCHELRLHGRRRGISSILSIEAVDHRVVLRSDGIGDVVLDISAPSFLFDCNDPMIDWINAVMILGLCDGEEMVQSVYSVDLDARALRPRPVRFRREGRTITIEKGADPRNDCRLLLDESSFALLEAESAGFRYRYE
jgi:hypothetical protein